MNAVANAEPPSEITPSVNALKPASVELENANAMVPSVTNAKIANAATANHASMNNTNRIVASAG